MGNQKEFLPTSEKHRRRLLHDQLGRDELIPGFGEEHRDTQDCTDLLPLGVSSFDSAAPIGFRRRVLSRNRCLAQALLSGSSCHARGRQSAGSFGRSANAAGRSAGCRSVPPLCAWVHLPSHSQYPSGLSSDSVQRLDCCDVGIHPIEGISSTSSAGPPRDPRSLEFSAPLPRSLPLPRASLTRARVPRRPTERGW